MKPLIPSFKAFVSTCPMQGAMIQGDDDQPKVLSIRAYRPAPRHLVNVLVTSGSSKHTSSSNGFMDDAGEDLLFG